MKFYNFIKNYRFQRIWGYLICRNRTYGLEDTNFRSLDIFLKNDLRNFRGGLLELSPELGKKVAGVVEKGPQRQVVGERRRDRQEESVG